MPCKTETCATKSQSTKRMWPNAAKIPPRNKNERPNRTTYHDGSNSNRETPSIARRRSLASATKRLATIKWYQMGITNVQGCKRPRVLTRKLNLNLKHNIARPKRARRKANRRKECDRTPIFRRRTRTTIDQTERQITMDQIQTKKHRPLLREGAEQVRPRDLQQ